MKGDTMVKLIETLVVAKKVAPIALAAGLILLAAGGFLHPFGDELPHDEGVLGDELPHDEGVL